MSTAPAKFRYVVVCGLTGSGKSRLLTALHDEGAQVLDLERLARHRGSLLGELPGDPQPSQKAFDTDLLVKLETFDPLRPVYVESESRKIGAIQVPDALLDAMRGAACVRVDTPRQLRSRLLRDEYMHFIADPALLAVKLSPLVPVHGRKVIEHWAEVAAAGDFDSLVDELLATHYDPTYGRSIVRNFPRHAEATCRDAARHRHARVSCPRARPRRPSQRNIQRRHLTMRQYDFRVVNVFAESPLAGNPLCVFEDARDLDEATMQALALQFNLSETTFLLPSSSATARVRIFTPTFEMPFAGHPTLGSAHAVRDLILPATR